MPLRVGIDLVSVEEVREAIREHGARYLERLFTPGELRDCGQNGEPEPERLAARFAAKEATLKVLRPGDQAVPWADIEVMRDPTGWVALELTGAAAALARDQGLDGFALSISHERGFATAVVVAERR